MATTKQPLSMISGILEIYKSTMVFGLRSVNYLSIPESILRNDFAHSDSVLLANLNPHDRDRLNDALDAELLCDDRGCLLSDDERGPVSVRADISRRDGQVGNFEPAHAVHVQLRVDDAALLARLHWAGAELLRNRKCKGTYKGMSSTTHALQSVEGGSHRVPARSHCPPARKINE